MKKLTILLMGSLILSGCLMDQTRSKAQQTHRQCSTVSEMAVVAMQLRDLGDTYRDIMAAGAQSGRQETFITRAMIRLPFDLPMVTSQREMSNIAYRHCTILRD